MDMLEVATQVARAMGPAFVAESDPENPRHSEKYATIIEPSFDPQAGFSLYHDAREKRIKVYPKWPTAKDRSEFPYSHDKPDVSITVGESRKPADIAREIERRFMPDYRAAFDRGVKGRDEHNAYIDSQSRNLAAFAELLGGTVRQEEVDAPMGDVDRFGYIRGFQAGADSVQWEFRSVPVDIARKVLEFWKSLQAK